MERLLGDGAHPLENEIVDEVAQLFGGHLAVIFDPFLNDPGRSDHDKSQEDLVHFRVMRFMHVPAGERPFAAEGDCALDDVRVAMPQGVPPLSCLPSFLMTWERRGARLIGADRGRDGAV